jgi:signal transduction histidine kinase/CheY-like chemotaxis protein
MTVRAEWTPRLRRHTFTVVLSAFACLIAAQFVIGQFLYTDGFREAEQRDLLARARHAQAVLRQGFGHITPGATDYAEWDATYEFVERPKTRYAENNFQAWTLQRFDADLAFIVDTGGRILLQRGLDVARKELASPSKAEIVAVQPGGSIWEQYDRHSAREGYIGIAGIPYQWASAPVRPPNLDGPSVGWLILLRRLGPQFVAELDHTLDSRSRFEIVAETSNRRAGASVPLRMDELQLGQPAAQTVDAAFVVGVLGRSGTLLLRLRTDRLLMAKVARISGYFFWASIAMGALIAAIAILWVQRRLLGPLDEISTRMQAIGSETDLSSRLPTIGRRDEISGVAIAANRMLAQIEAKRDAERSRDAAVAASRSKSDFLARMSHEIRTPMNGVLGMTELLEGTSLGATQRRYAETIRHSAKALLTIINDILDFSKIEAGKIELDDAPFDVEQIVDDAVELVAELAFGKGLALLCRLSPELHTAYRGDGLRLRQVLINLLGNAIKFTQRGQIEVRVNEKHFDAQTMTTLLKFEVHDSGIGIRAESQAAIFESFCQADGSTTRNHGGTGLGLAICKQLVELMGGDIGVRSMPAEGSIFWFTLPLRRDAAPALRLRHEVLRGRRILVAYGNETQREILRELLASWHITVVEAANADEALRRLKAASDVGEFFDLALLENELLSTGYQNLRQTLAASDTRSPGIVLLCAKSDKFAGEKWPTGRAPACVTKPVRRTQLLTALTRMVRDEPTDTEKLRALSLDRPKVTRLLKKSVLVVEDNLVNQEVACGMLQHLGCEVTIAGDGLAGATAFETSRFDAVLMDCHMPVLDGYAATRRIRAWEALQQRVRTPIIALTANALADDAEKCLAAGMDSYLSKPFTLAQLQSVLESPLLAAAGHAVDPLREQRNTG